MAPYRRCQLFRLAIRSRGHHNGTYHNKETHANSLADLDEFTLIGYWKSQRVMNSRKTADQHTLGAAANKLGTLPDEVLRDIGKLLESLRHGGEQEEL